MWGFECSTVNSLAVSTLKHLFLVVCAFHVLLCELQVKFETFKMGTFQVQEIEKCSSELRKQAKEMAIGDNPKCWCKSKVVMVRESGSECSDLNLAFIIGGVVGGVVGACCCCAGIWFMRKRTSPPVLTESPPAAQVATLPEPVAQVVHVQEALPPANDVTTTTQLQRPGSEQGVMRHGEVEHAQANFDAQQRMPTPQLQTAKFCSQCGYRPNPGARFCRSCGNAIAALA